MIRRKSEREIERAVDRLETTLPPDHDAAGDEELTERVEELEALQEDDGPAPVLTR